MTVQKPASIVERSKMGRLVAMTLSLFVLGAGIFVALEAGNQSSAGMLTLYAVGSIATACAFVYLLRLIRFNDELSRSLVEANTRLDAQVKVRTQELSEAIEDVRKQKVFLRSVIDALPSFVVAQSADGSIILANEETARLFGKPTKELQGASYSDIVSASNPSAAAIIAAEAKIMLDGTPVVATEREIAAADGRTRIYEVVKTPIIGKSGFAEQFLIVGNDITVRKEAERSLTEARDAAENSARVKSQFLATISHEIRTPMNGVLGFTDLLLAENLPEAHRDLALTIKASAESLLAIINDILDISKLDAGQIAVDCASTSLTVLCSELIDQFRPIAASASIAMRADVHIDPSARFLTDATRVKQIIGNLISNAIKFTHEGTVSLDVDLIRQSRDVAKVRFTVKDTGIGIPSARLETIFDTFSQVDSSMTRRYGGVGLGLSLCKNLVRLLGGKISVESTEGEGSIIGRSSAKSNRCGDKRCF